MGLTVSSYAVYNFLATHLQTNLSIHNPTDVQQTTTSLGLKSNWSPQKATLGDTLYIGKGKTSATNAVLQLFGVERNQCCQPCAGFALTSSFARPWRGRSASQNSLPPAIQCCIWRSLHIMSAINQLIDISQTLRPAG